MNNLQAAVTLLYACFFVGVIPAVVASGVDAPPIPILWGAWCFAMGMGEGSDWGGIFDDLPPWIRLAATIVVAALVGCTPAVASAPMSALLFWGLACLGAGFVAVRVWPEIAP